MRLSDLTNVTILRKQIETHQKALEVLTNGAVYYNVENWPFWDNGDTLQKMLDAEMPEVSSIVKRAAIHLFEEKIERFKDRLALYGVHVDV